MLIVDIHKTLGSFHLDVSFESENGVLALLGASGCGKSMTLKCIAGIETPDSGRIELNGRVLYDSSKHINLPPQKRKVGYLFQQYALFPNMNVEKNIATAVRHLSKEQQSKIIKENIERFRLQGLEKHKISELSGGQQQRVALARIFASHPEVLLLDEPFAALDSYLKWQLELELMDVLHSFDGNVLYVSHDRDEVYRLCDSVCVLTKGTSEPQSTVKELMRTPGTVSAALLSGCKNYSRIRKLSDHSVECIDWGITLQVSEPADDSVTYIGLRAHSVTLDGGENKVTLKIHRIVEEPFSTVLMLETPAGNRDVNLIRAEFDKQDIRQYSESDMITLFAPSDKIMLLKGTGPND